MTFNLANLKTSLTSAAAKAKEQGARTLNAAYAFGASPEGTLAFVVTASVGAGAFVGAVIERAANEVL